MSEKNYSKSETIIEKSLRNLTKVLSPLHCHQISVLGDQLRLQRSLD